MARLTLSLLGPLHATLDSQPVTTFKYDKVRALLAYLAVEADRPHEREALLGLLWPDLPEDAARNNLRQTLLTLREALGDRTAQPPFVLASRATIQLNPHSDYWLDVAAFTGLLAESRGHRHASAAGCSACARRLQRALELYRGPFLSEFFLPDSEAFEEWALLRREQLHRQMLDALAQLVAHYERRGAYATALEYAHRQLAADPWREESHRDVMRLQMLSGQRGAALAQFERCRQLLAETLGVEPDAETTALYQQIRSAADEGAPELHRLSLPTARRHNLPAQPTPFVGREAELEAIGRLLDDEGCRLLTLVGPGGIGKTRLGLQAATERVDTFADGVCFVALAGLPSADLLVSEIAAALGVELGTSADPRATLLGHLRERELLLVLDNFEHLVAGADLLAEIVRAAPDVTLLVTSRERLLLHGEWVYAVEGLPVPDGAGLRGAALEELAANDAVQLFVQSARRARADFALSAENAADVVRICQLVAGMPLAIELAANWSRALTCAEIAQEIERGSAFLATSMARDGPERHRSLQAVFDHSWRMLSGEEQRVMRQLAVFRGGFRRDAAQDVAGAALPVLASLVDRSLLRHTLGGRYELHELVRQYAAQQLSRAGEEERALQRHAAYFGALAEAADPQLVGPEQQLWLARLDQEHDNLRAALRWALEGRAVPLALTTGAALRRFWAIRGAFVEGRAWLERALARASGRDVPPEARLQALNAAGTLARLQGDLARGQELLEECLALSRASGARYWSATALNGLGLVARRRGDPDRAAALYEESLALAREIGDERSIVNALSNLAGVVNAQGDHARAAELYEESLAFSRRAGDQLGIAADLNNLANAIFDLGDYPRAQALYEESLALYRSGGDEYGASLALYNLGDLAHRQGQLERARAHLGEALTIAHTLHNHLGRAEYLEKLASLAAAERLPELAARLWGAVERERSALGAARPPQQAAEHAAEVEAARAQAGEAAFAAAWAAGESMAIEQAVAEALQYCAPRA